MGQRIYERLYELKYRGYLARVWVDDRTECHDQPIMALINNALHRAFIDNETPTPDSIAIDIEAHLHEYKVSAIQVRGFDERVSSLIYPNWP